jgi:hypothetical protein
MCVGTGDTRYDAIWHTSPRAPTAESVSSFASCGVSCGSGGFATSWAASSKGESAPASLSDAESAAECGGTRRGHVGASATSRQDANRRMQKGRTQ